MNNDIFPLIYNNKEKYISKECIDIVEKLWNLNIAAYEVNKNDDYIYIKLDNLSRNNIKKFYNNHNLDERYYVDYKLDGQYLRVKKENIYELYDLIDIFDFQDSLEYTYDTLLLKEYNNGELINEYEDNKNIEEILSLIGIDNSLYIKEEGKIYKNKIYLDWHDRFINKKKK